MSFIKETNPKARKNYICDGREQLLTFVDDVDDNLEIEQQIQLCKGIIKGENYVNETQVEDGIIQHWKSCKGCHETIHKFKLYPKY
jgi:hypothetical protein